MLSDRRIARRNLVKWVCRECGLVRSGSPFDGLGDYYEDEYNTSHQPEHQFYTADGPVPRSQVMCDWLVSGMGEWRWHGVRRCLEVGAGRGLLLRALSRRFPHTAFLGVEPSQHGVRAALADGVHMRQGTVASIREDEFDAVYSIATVEHVNSPSDFLRDIRCKLRPGGMLFLVQPTQDVPSYDVFFVDHLHHFGSEHLRQYATKCGFREHGFVVGHPLMPTFSLHLWQAVEHGSSRMPFHWGYTACREVAAQLVADTGRLDALLDRLERADRRVAVFGLSEVYWLLCAYSRLGSFQPVCGLDDEPKKPEYAKLSFPVMCPEDCVALGVQDAILAMNKNYYPLARERLEKLGIRAHAALT